MSSKLAVGLSDGDAAELAELVAEAAAAQRDLAAAQARQYRALARAGSLARAQGARQTATVRMHDMALRSIAAELGTVLHTPDRSMQRRIGEAMQIVEDYPATLNALETATVTNGHVRTIVETGAVLPPELRAEFEQIALRECEGETPGRVRARLELLAERQHPRTLVERHREAREGRRVRVIPLPDGMSDLCATMPTLLADAIYDRLTQQGSSIQDARPCAAKTVRGSGAAFAITNDRTDGGSSDGAGAAASDVRTMDQIRTDLLADMLLTAAPDADPTRTDDGPGTLGAIRARVQVVVPFQALLGSDREPVELVGSSPFDAETARALAEATKTPWDRILTHPVSGGVLAVDTYERTTAIDRYVKARDRRCRFPGCRRPAVRCEVDHTIDFALGGKTDVCNLCSLCQRHHTMKQFTPWRVRQLDGGVIEWTSPLGFVYIDKPPTHGVGFADPDPPLDRNPAPGRDLGEPAPF